MDQYLSTVIIALISGVFSLITLVINKKQDKVINDIDEQNMIIKKERELKKKLTQKEKEREKIVQEIMLLILDTNMSILKTQSTDTLELFTDAFNTSKELKSKYDDICKSIEELQEKYDMVLDMTSQFKRESNKSH